MLLTFMISRNYFNFLVESKSPKTEALIAYEDIPDNTTLETGIEAIEQV